MDNGVLVINSDYNFITTIEKSHVSKLYLFIKRVFDIAVSLFVLTIFLVPMLIIAIAIKLESKGPVFFKQKRTGKNGKEFEIIKFRSMSTDNDVLNFSSENKITKVGSFLRKTSLDEMPQFISILKNDLSLVGPRPWIPEYFDNFTKFQKRRVEVKPGLTGLAQCKGRNGISVLEKINYDIEYVDNMSLLLDLKIIFLTVKCVLSKSGAELSKFGIKDELETLHENQERTDDKLNVIIVSGI